MPWLILKLFACVLLSHSIDSATDTDVRNLLMELFTTRSYNKLVRPVVDQSEPVDVFLEYFLFGVNDINEIEQKLTTTGYLEIYWHDIFLTWNPSDFGNLTYLYIPQDNIWKPDISLKNGFKDLKELGSKFIQIFLTFDGSILWQPFQIFESKCNLDPTHFPFDRQTCSLDFIVWSLDADDVTLFIGTDGINMAEAFESNGQWDVESSSSSSSSSSPEIVTSETLVRFSINVKRKPLFVIMNVIMPIFLLSILNIFTFQIPTDSGERMGYTITVWLAFAVFLTIVSGLLPQSSDTIPVLSIYIMIQIGIGTLTVVISSIQSRVVSRADDKPVTSFLRCLVRVVRKHKIRSETTDAWIDMDTNVTWKDGMSALDMVLFWAFLVILVITTFIILMISAFVQ